MSVQAAATLPPSSFGLGLPWLRCVEPCLIVTDRAEFCVDKVSKVWTLKVGHGGMEKEQTLTNTEKLEDERISESLSPHPRSLSRCTQWS